MALGNEIRTRREAKDWRQHDLAEAVGVNGSYISALETDRIESPRIDLVERIARALDCTPNDLLGFKNGSAA